MRFCPLPPPPTLAQPTLFQILLFEHDYLRASGTRHWLSQQPGYVVRLTDRPEELLLQCEAGVVDLVLLDAVRSIASCPAILSHQLKSNPKTAHIPIVLLSSDGLVEGSWLEEYRVDAISRSVLSLPGTLEQVRQMCASNVSSCFVEL